ncbi:uncharacterized protein isoform X1 [Choristoneura fumiferana]|uniref:uncharacterized protein isoform X1 n=1 Tax=Choristoneura fumiferana TaxID=7141 RepID=UPI003D15A31C
MAASAAAQQSARGAMESRSLLLVLSGAFVVFLAAPASGQSFEDPTLFYKNMTFEFDVRHRGEVGIPSCVKQLMECWDIIRSDITCTHLDKIKLFHESACSVMRHQRCNEYAPFGEYGATASEMLPYDNFHIFEQYCVDNVMGYWT